jgi:hypothetical protein
VYSCREVVSVLLITIAHLKVSTGCPAENCEPTVPYANHGKKKGQCLEIFCFDFFSWIIFPQVRDFPRGAILEFFSPKPRDSDPLLIENVGCTEKEYSNTRWESDCSE